MCEAGLGYLQPWGFVCDPARAPRGWPNCAVGSRLGDCWGGLLGVSRAAASDKAAAPPQRAGQWNEWAINTRQWEAGDAPLKSSGSSERPSFFSAAPGAVSTRHSSPPAPSGIPVSGSKGRGSPVGRYAVGYGTGASRTVSLPGSRIRPARELGMRRTQTIQTPLTLMASRESLGGPEWFAGPWMCV